jgi:beta-lactamase superfamily II metal-dependent hydrolase
VTVTSGSGAAPAVRVRMYDVGFGDCFLLTFPARDRERLVLIDCGVHSASKRQGLDAAIANILQLVARAGNRIDVVVATHRHRDHVHGFRDEDRWAGVDVGEVWMPWTEDPEDPEARRIRDRQSKRSALLLSLMPAKAGEAWSGVRAIADNNGLTNARAMATLHRGFAGDPARSFLPEPEGKPRSSSFQTPVLPGVTVHILGPSRDPRAIRDMDPPAAEAYLQMGTGTELATDGRLLPFDRWRREQRDYLDRFHHFDITGTDLGSIVSAGRTNALGLAVALEQAVNGTSLMLSFECGDLNLLFAGDAQWGTWDRALADPRKADHLERTTLYKVGHHGSHNATPRRFVEQLLGRAECALVSVAPTTIPSWSDLPRAPLLQALADHCAVLRSDQPGAQTVVGKPLAITRAPDDLWVEVSLPTRRDG